MDLENNENLPSDISQFLDQFEKENSELEKAFASGRMNYYSSVEPQEKQPAKDKDESFKKLEEKISELEKKFEVSIKEKELLLAELAKSSRDENERSKTRDEFFSNISNTINNLKDSVERLNRTQTQQRPVFMPQTEIYGSGYYYGAPIDQASKVGQEEVFRAHQEAQKYLAELNKTKEEVSSKQNIIENYQQELGLQGQTIAAQKTEIAQSKTDKEEKERFIEGLKEKASRLKAVNSALEKEFKRVQEEKIEVLRKSAEQAKEILALRDQLTKTEERFKAFDFEGRILSIKNDYQQKVAKLETQLKEVSAVCMKQVEEIESLKTENLRLESAQAEVAALQARLEEKNKEITALRAEVNNITKHSQETLITLTSATSKNKAELQEKMREAQGVLQARIEAAGAAFRQKEMEVERHAISRIQEAERKAAEKETAASDAVKDITRKANNEISALNRRLVNLQTERDQISERLKVLASGVKTEQEERKKTEDSFKLLMEKVKENDLVIEKLKKKIDVLDKENKHLKNRPHAVLEKHGESPSAQTAAPQTAPAAKEELNYPDPSARKTATRAKAAALGEEFEGKKDFLEDTQTFFGRMKWSLLKDD